MFNKRCKNMRKISINEKSLNKFINLIKEDDNDEIFDEYEDETYYSKYDYMKQIESYLNGIIHYLGSGYVEVESDSIYLDMIDFKIIVALDDKTGILYIENIEMYDRTSMNDAFTMDDMIIKILTYFKSKPLNVSQKLNRM